MYRVGITKKDGTTEAKNFSTKEKCEEWVLEQGDTLKKAIIVDKNNIKNRESINFGEE